MFSSYEIFRYFLQSITYLFIVITSELMTNSSNKQWVSLFNCFMDVMSVWLIFGHKYTVGERHKFDASSDPLFYNSSLLNESLKKVAKNYFHEKYNFLFTIFSTLFSNTYIKCIYNKVIHFFRERSRAQTKNQYSFLFFLIHSFRLSFCVFFEGIVLRDSEHR